LGADGGGDAVGVGFLGQDVRRGFEESGPARAGEIVADGDAAFELAECFRGGNAFDLDPVFTGVSVAGVEESGDEGGFVGEEEQTFGVGVEAADGVDARGEAELAEGALAGEVGCETGEDAEGFVEDDEHGGPGGWLRCQVGEETERAWSRAICSRARSNQALSGRA